MFSVFYSALNNLMLISMLFLLIKKLEIEIQKNNCYVDSQFANNSKFTKVLTRDVSKLNHRWRSTLIQ